MSKPLRLSNNAARRIAIAAQGLDRPRPEKPTRRHVEATIARLGLLQIDAVNVVARAHYMPLFSRLGAYDPALLDAVWLGKKRTTFEYWGHEASILPHDAFPLMRWRMEAARNGDPFRAGRGETHAVRWRAYAKEKRAYLDAVLAEIRERGALGASELSEAGARKGPWWGWSDGKIAVEYLFRVGDLTTHSRRGFERVYDLPERVHPASLLAHPPPAPRDAVLELARRGLAAMGVATSADIADYFRLPAPAMKNTMADLIESGAALPVEVEGWRGPAFLDPAARTPRRVEAAALLNPFDPLIWRRDRVLRLFDFEYTIEIYVPQEKRKFGYYVLPFLQGDMLAARVDLKADRAGDVLLVQAAHLETHADAKETAEALARELHALRGWLNLSNLKIEKRGGLAKALAAAA